MRHFAPLLILAFVLGSCGSDVPGYPELDLSPTEDARKGVFDAAASYELVQVVLEQAVMSPAISPEMKTLIQQVDLEATEALKNYRAAVNAGGDDLTAKLAVFMQILMRAQVLLLEAQAEGLV